MTEDGHEHKLAGFYKLVKENSQQYFLNYLKGKNNSVTILKVRTKLHQVLSERELKILKICIFHFPFLSGTN